MALAWNIDLSEPPRIRLIGTAVHGEARLTESYDSNYWVLLFFRYHGQIVVDGHTLRVAPNWLGLFPPVTTLTIHYQGRSSHHYAHFALPAGRGRELSLPAMTPLGGSARQVEARYIEAIRRFHVQPERSAALLWDILWSITEMAPAPPSRAGVPAPAVASLLGRIEERLGEPVSVSELLAGLGYSPRRIGELFREFTGMTPGEYLRRRRAERATQLLRSTTLPIKRIAAAVGMPDLQQFNKLMRRVRGLGPRSIRCDKRGDPPTSALPAFPPPPTAPPAPAGSPWRNP